MKLKLHLLLIAIMVFVPTTAMAFDVYGNIYVTGKSENLTPYKYNYDFVTIKYNANGDQIWVKRYDSSWGGDFADDIPTAIEKDEQGNIYVAGSCAWHRWIIDYLIIKYDSMGNMKWVQHYDYDESSWLTTNVAKTLAVDNSGNVYLTGYSKDVGEYSSSLYLTLKYDSNGNLLWNAIYDGPFNTIDVATAIKVDSAGNVFVTGHSGTHGATIKYDANGVQLWIDIYDEQGYPYYWPGFFDAIAMDNSGNIYVIGRGLADNASNLSYDYLTIKYDTNGNRLWVRTYEDNNEITDRNYAKAISVDTNGNAYITGFTEGADHTLSYSTLKYNSSGNLLWATKYSESSNGFSKANALAVDYYGNVYVTGSSNGSGAISDFVTVKYTSNGNQAWVKRYNSPPEGMDISYSSDAVVDANGNIYVTGTSEGEDSFLDYYTIKYDPAGNQLWKNTFALQGEVYSMFVDSQHNVYVTGKEEVSYADDYLTIKYDSNGNQVWAKTYDGPTHNNDSAYSISGDSSGYIYITGASGTGYDITTSDYATIKYDSEGTEQWIRRHDGIGHGNDYAYKVTLDPAGNVYVAGSATNADAEPDLNFTIVNYDWDGNELWTTTHTDPASTDDYTSNGLFVDSLGNIIVAGNSYGILTNWDYLIIKYQQSLVPLLFSLKPVIDDSSSTYPNGIIESDETVSLLGAIYNRSLIQASNVSGLLTTYSPIIIHNPFGTYPDISPVNTAQCTACYSLTAPSAYRPAQHWDISATERTSCQECSPRYTEFYYHVGNSFDDVPPANIFYLAIETLFHYQAISGCNASSYCPQYAIQRQQIAKILCRAMEAAQPGSCNAASCSQIFADVPASNIFCPYIEAIYSSGIVAGCQSSPLLYCPDNYLQRQASAKLLCLAMNNLQPGSCAITACAGIFTDVPPANPFCSYIEGLYNAGVVNGCTSKTRPLYLDKMAWNLYDKI